MDKAKYADKHTIWLRSSTNFQLPKFGRRSVFNPKNDPIYIEFLFSQILFSLFTKVCFVFLDSTLF